jgi:hypothetical protein
LAGGIDVYMEGMKKITNRKNYIQKYVDDQRSNRWISKIAIGTLLNDKTCLTLA